jgi:hypothetical protein
MAARLLISKEPLIHTLADDLESFLHVLSWVALRYMPHGLGPGRLTSILHSIFDRGQDGRFNGGIDKEAHIASGTVPWSGFHNDFIVSLLSVLTETVAARYEGAPTEQKQFLRRPWQKSTEPDDATRQAKLALLETSDFMLGTFREVTQDRDTWPADDKSVTNELLATPISGRKRKSDIGPDGPQQKLRYSRSRTAS